MRINTDKDRKRIERFLDLYFVKLCFLGFFFFMGEGGKGGGGGRHWVLNWIVKKINLLNETTVDLAMLLS